MGLRNEDEFKPPTPNVRPGGETVAVGSAVNFNPTLRHLRGSTANLGLQIRDAGIGRAKTQWERAEAAMEMETFRIAGNEKYLDQKPQSQQQPQPKKVAKLGLRETLLMHGRQPYGNQVRTELRSLTFHDLTPDMRTLGFKNELLAHFETDKDHRTKLVCYEVDV
jgi:hypothetical protein